MHVLETACKLYIKRYSKKYTFKTPDVDEQGVAGSWVDGLIVIECAATAANN